MSGLNAIVNSLEKKIEKLVDLHRQGKNQISTFQNLNQQLTQSNEQQKQIIKELEEKNKILKAVKTLSGNNENTHEVKLKINELVREIDKCIALLNK